MAFSVTRRTFGLSLGAGLAAPLISGPRLAGAQDVAIGPRFDSVGHFHEGIAPAREGEIWGFIDRGGNWIIRPRYDGVLRGGGGRFGIRENGRWGFIDSAANVVVEPRYEEAQPFAHGVAAVKRRGAWGFITAFGAVETPFQFPEIGRREGVSFPAIFTGESGITGWHSVRTIPGAGVRDQGKFSVFDRQAQRPVEPKKVHGFSEGATVVTYEFGEMIADTNAWRLVDGEFPQDVVFESIRRRSEGWAAATRGGRWGYITDQRRFQPFRGVEAAREFTEGVAPVRIGGKWGYMRKDGSMAYRPTFTRAYSFHEGFATMRMGEKRGFLRMDGGRVSVFVDGTYEDVFRFQEGLAPIKTGGKWGFLSNGVRRPTHSVRGVVDVIPQ